MHHLLLKYLRKYGDNTRKYLAKIYGLGRSNILVLNTSKYKALPCNNQYIKSFFRSPIDNIMSLRRSMTTAYFID